MKRIRLAEWPWNPPAAALLSVLFGLATLANPLARAQDVPDLEGNWIRGDFVGLGESEDLNEEVLTAEGRRQWDAYNYLTDDPAYGCVSASWARVWLNPNVVIRITQTENQVRFQHEFMDIDRQIPLVDPTEANPERVRIEGLPTLGSSMAWYDGETLVIDTIDYAPGYISTIANLAGLPQSRTMHTVERISREGDNVTVEITHQDPTIFRKPFVVTISFAPTDYELLDYGCTPDDASLVAPD